MNNDVNEYDLLSVQITKRVQQVIDSSYEKMKCVWTSDMKMDMYAPNMKKCYQNYSFYKHNKISKEMIYFEITKYFAQKDIFGSGFKDLCIDSVSIWYKMVKSQEMERLTNSLSLIII